MAYKTFNTRFPIRKLHKKKVFKKMQGLTRKAGAHLPRQGSGQKGISRRGK